MRFFELLAGIAQELLAPLTGTAAKKTLCCDVPMHDLWMHAKGCPNAKAIEDKIRAWRAANPDQPGWKVPNFAHVPPRGDKGGLCPECGFPTGHYGLYTVGEPCSWCGYVEKRKP